MLQILKKLSFNLSVRCKTGLAITLVNLLAVSLQTASAFQISDQLTQDRSQSALSHAYSGMDDDTEDSFTLGRSFFTIPWVVAPASTTARDGLGPLFNANSCASCHKNNAGGATLKQSGIVDRSILIKLAQSGEKVTDKKMPFVPDPVYGGQFSINGTGSVPFEGKVHVELTPLIKHYADGTDITLYQPEFNLKELNYGSLSKQTVIDALRAPSLVGLGLIEQIPDEELIKHADPEDKNSDGISGKANKVWSLEKKKLVTGRYGWKATTPSVIEQTANALLNDMGLTSPWLKQENCTPKQLECLKAYKSQDSDINLVRLQGINTYLTHLKLPESAKLNDQQGKQLFTDIGCISCHRTGYSTTTGDVVNPYSDFLLHDMGKDLAGKINMYEAKATEWRTPPLWGIGLAKKLNTDAGFLHDGRAQTLEQAIMWHGGEAEKSQKAFAKLTKSQRQSLIAFLNSL